MSLSLSAKRKQHKKRTIQHLSQWQNRLANLTSGNKLNFRSWMSRIVEPVLFTLICTVIQCLRWKLNVFLCIYMPLKFPFGIISPEINAHKIYLSVTHSHIRLDSYYVLWQSKKCASKIPNDCFRVCLHFVSYQFMLSNGIWSDSSGILHTPGVRIRFANMKRMLRGKHVYALRIIMSPNGFSAKSVFLKLSKCDSKSQIETSL